FDQVLPWNMREESSLVAYWRCNPNSIAMEEINVASARIPKWHAAALSQRLEMGYISCRLLLNSNHIAVSSAFDSTCLIDQLGAVRRPIECCSIIAQRHIGC